LEGGHEEGGINTGKEAYQEGSEGDRHQDVRVQQALDRKLQAGDGVDPGQRKPGEGYSQQDGHIRNEDRFAEKLEDDFLSLCPGDFADTYFFSPEGGAGRRQVHIIDAGDE